MSENQIKQGLSAMVGVGGSVTSESVAKQLHQLSLIKRFEETRRTYSFNRLFSMPNDEDEEPSDEQRNAYIEEQILEDNPEDKWKRAKD